MDAETGRQKPPLKCADAHRDQNPGIEWPKIPAETPYQASCRNWTVCKGWMVVCAVKYEPVSLLFDQKQGDFPEKQRADYEKSQKCPLTSGFLLSGQIREQGETGSIDRRKQGDDFADSGSKSRILFAPGRPLSMSVFEVRADKCAAHAPRLEADTRSERLTRNGGQEIFIFPICSYREVRYWPVLTLSGLIEFEQWPSLFSVELRSVASKPLSSLLYIWTGTNPRLPRDVAGAGRWGSRRVGRVDCYPGH